MSDPSHYSIFSSRGIEELAMLVAGLLPGNGFYVTTTYEELGKDLDMVSFGPDTGDLPSIAIARNQKHINDIRASTRVYPPWSFDPKEHPVLFFSIEGKSAKCYGSVGIALSKKFRNFDDDTVIYPVLAFIREHLPEPPDGEDYLEVGWIYGALTNPKNCHDVDLFNQD